jgi:hypothetical protein
MNSKRDYNPTRYDLGPAKTPDVVNPKGYRFY